MLRFADPGYLWLLALLPLVWLLARRLRIISPGRRYTILFLRTLLVLCIVFALARLEWRKISRDLSVFYLLDRSDSIPAEQQDTQTALLEELSETAGPNDQTGVIVFGRQPSIETSPVRGFEYEGQILSQYEGERTDIASALRLSMAAFPADSMKRVVLMSDGNENMGSSMEIARIARNTGVPVDVIPLRYNSRNDVQVEKVVLPQRTSKDAPFDMKVYLSSQEETEGTLRIFEDGELIIEEETTVRPGRNAPLVLTRRLQEGGFHNYTATFDAPGDLRPQNNKANAFTYLKAEPRVLMVEGGSPDDARYLVGALQAENIAVTAVVPNQLPTTLDALQRFDSILLSNVSADRMSVAQMRMLERAVHDLGIGMIMIGGEDSFGAGGYIDTPIELALPVSMDIKQKKMLPNGALAIVLHTCEIPSGNAWAREISLASLNVLSSQDYFGLVYFGYGSGMGSGYGETWLWEPGMQMVGDKKAMRTKIKGVQPGDAPNFDPMLRMAADELGGVKAQTKHIIVISDGDPAPPTKSTVRQIRDEGITVSGVAIAPHSGMSVDSLKEMALWGSGTFYYPKTSSELPRIFTKEATIVRKSLIREETFSPRASAPSEVLIGVDALPQLDGYVVTSIKDLATEALSTEWDDPLMAHWRYGLGKTAAFTSDAKDKWASQWVSWGGFSKFWAQLVRWSLRETNNLNYQVNTQVQGGQGKVTIDAVDEQGNFQNFLDFDTTVIGPDFEPQELSVQQVAPGRYEGTFPASKVGTYMLSMVANPDGEETPQDPQFITSGVSLSYSPEYETSTSSEEFLRRLADASGGEYVEGDPLQYNPYNRNLTPPRAPRPMWPLLLLLGAILLPADVFVRRVYLDWAAIWNRVREAIPGLRPRRTAAQANERMDSLRAAKSRALRGKEEAKEDRAARAAFRERMEEKASEGAPSESVFDRSESEKGAPRRGKQTVTAEERERPGGQAPQGGMSSLMEAKKRAQEKTRKKK